MSARPRRSNRAATATVAPTAAATQRASSLRPLRVPESVQVRTGGDGMPVAVARRAGQWQRVAQVDDIWRIAEEWWREAPQQRTYLRVILDHGGPLTLFFDRTTRSWYRQEYP